MIPTKLVLAIALAATLGAPAPALAETEPGSHYFNGTCFDCGPEPLPASATLRVDKELRAYFSFHSANFVNGLFSTEVQIADLGAFNDLGWADADIRFSTEPMALPHTDELADSWIFRSSELYGSWTLSGYLADREDVLGSVSADYGDKGVWSLRPNIPEPATGALLALGLAALALRRGMPAR